MGFLGWRRGLSWLALGRAQLHLGKEEDARRSLQSAVEHLSNSVDASHPALVEARTLLVTSSAISRGNGPATAP